MSYYNKELTFLKEMGREFAQQYPKIASRLALDTTDIPDPYVERLLEGVSFLTARTQLKLDAEYPRFVQRILEVVYPDFINQKPAAAIVNLEPTGQYNADVINLLERGRVLRSLPIDEFKVSCPFSVTKTTEIQIYRFARLFTKYAFRAQGICREKSAICLAFGLLTQRTWRMFGNVAG